MGHPEHIWWVQSLKRMSGNGLKDSSSSRAGTTAAALAVKPVLPAVHPAAPVTAHRL